ncbi:MAG TPA: dienelactone hydrolase family protein [Streptosporangiaceae bacterium]|nr:dienelactone hydrolase family protein [Streptosporangiaceae bacterium]
MNSTPAHAEAEIATRDLRYSDQDTPLTGYLCWNPAPGRPAPGVLLIHGGAGLDDHARQQARRYAALGYTVLAADMYGDGVAGDRERVMTALLALRDDPAALVRRGAAGLTALAACPETAGPETAGPETAGPATAGPRTAGPHTAGPHTAGRETAAPGLAAVGFCFGGLAALALARSGQADLAAVVTMHGSLATATPAAPGAVGARLLVCHGAQDPHVPMTDVTAFAAEMTAAGADWQVNMYGSAMHGFTHQHAAPGAQPGVAYDLTADKRSFAAASDFLAAALLGRRPYSQSSR